MASSARLRSPQRQSDEHDPPSAPKQPQRKPRIYYLDNIRTLLTVLVVFQHTASAYGADGSWHYVSEHHGRSIPLIIFKAINRSYLMATFFFLSGYFSALTGRKRSRSAFLKEKTLRLGIPTLLSTFLSGPIQLAILRVIQDGRVPDQDMFTTYWKSVRGVRGPVWYTGLLLLFDAVYILLRPGPTRGEQRRPRLTRARVLSGVTWLALVSFAVRIYYPAGKNFVPLSIRPGYVPQYLGAYALGILVSGQDPKIIPSLGLRPRLLAMSTASAAGIALGCAVSTGSPLKAMRGGWNVPAFAYAFWHESTGLLVLSGLLELFSTKRSLQGNWGALGKYSYAAFLVHAPALVTFMGLLDGWRAGGMSKTLGVGSLGVVGSWIGGWITAQLPGWRRCVV